MRSAASSLVSPSSSTSIVKLFWVESSEVAAVPAELLFSLLTLPLGFPLVAGAPHWSLAAEIENLPISDSLSLLASSLVVEPVHSILTTLGTCLRLTGLQFPRGLVLHLDELFELSRESFDWLVFQSAFACCLFHNFRHSCLAEPLH